MCTRRSAPSCVINVRCFCQFMPIPIVPGLLTYNRSLSKGFAQWTITHSIPVVVSQRSFGVWTVPWYLSCRYFGTPNLVLLRKVLFVSWSVKSRSLENKFSRKPYRFLTVYAMEHLLSILSKTFQISLLIPTVKCHWYSEVGHIQLACMNKEACVMDHLPNDPQFANLETLVYIFVVDSHAGYLWAMEWYTVLSWRHVVCICSFLISFPKNSIPRHTPSHRCLGQSCGQSPTFGIGIFGSV